MMKATDVMSVAINQVNNKIGKFNLAVMLSLL